MEWFSSYFVPVPLTTIHLLLPRQDLNSGMDCKFFWVILLTRLVQAFDPTHTVNNGGFRGWEYSTAKKENIEEWWTDLFAFGVLRFSRHKLLKIKTELRTSHGFLKTSENRLKRVGSTTERLLSWVEQLLLFWAGSDSIYSPMTCLVAMDHGSCICLDADTVFFIFELPLHPWCQRIAQRMDSHHLSWRNWLLASCKDEAWLVLKNRMMMGS